MTNISGATYVIDYVLSNIVLKDPVGNTLSSWQLIMADAESTNKNPSNQTESIRFTASSNITLIDRITGSTTPTLTGLGTTVATITGTADAIPSQPGATSYLLGVTTPTTITTRITSYSQQAIAFAVVAGDKATLSKNISERSKTTDQFTYSITTDIWGTPPTGASATTSGSSTGLQTQVTLGPLFYSGVNFLFRETMASGALNHYAVTYTCTPTPSPLPTLSVTSTAASFKVPTSGPVILTGSTTNTPPTMTEPSKTWACTITNTPTLDLSITKTNTFSAGPSDQSNDTVASGAPTTYTILVTNNGLATVRNAKVTDTASSSLSCGTSTVLCTNVVGTTGCPASPNPITFSNLQSGLLLGEMNSGDQVKLSFSCTVN